MRFRNFLFLLFATMLVGCAHTMRERLRVGKTETAIVYDGIVKAIAACGYTILHTDKVTGVITAGRNAMNVGTGREVGRQLRVSTVVVQDGDDVIVMLTWTPPEMAFGDLSTEQLELIKAMRDFHMTAEIVNTN